MSIQFLKTFIIVIFFVNSWMSHVLPHIFTFLHCFEDCSNEHSDKLVRLKVHKYPTLVNGIEICRSCIKRPLYSSSHKSLSTIHLRRSFFRTALRINGVEKMPPFWGEVGRKLFRTIYNPWPSPLSCTRKKYKVFSSVCLDLIDRGDLIFEVIFLTLCQLVRL